MSKPSHEPAADPRPPEGKPLQSGGPVAAETIADLAAAGRILFAQGVVDGYGHVSMRHPQAPDRFLMARAMAPGRSDAWVQSTSRAGRKPSARISSSELP